MSKAHATSIVIVAARRERWEASQRPLFIDGELRRSRHGFKRGNSLLAAPPTAGLVGIRRALQVAP